MSRDKQIDEMAKVLCEDCARDVEPCILNRTGRRCNAVMEQAKALYNAGYLKASDVAMEIFEEIDNFQRKLRHIFLGMCGGNDYNTLNLLQIDNAIEALYDTFIAELKKKYPQEK